MNDSRRYFLKKGVLGSLGLWLGNGRAEVVRGGLVRSAPEIEGVSSQGILDFLDAVEDEGFELHSLMVLRHGKVVAEGWWEPYGPELVHTMYSMSKSFTSTAVGFAVAEGKLNVEDKVISFFPDELPEKVSANLASMRIKDLLTMSTGNEREPTQVCVDEENWVRTFLAQTIAHPPGTRFMYNSAATYMCSAIVQKVTGMTILEYLKQRLFVPLGIVGMSWETCPMGINTGGWGLSLQTEGMAKFGQFLLQKGVWEGKRLLSEAWVEEATRFHIQQPGEDKPERPKAKNDWLQGYGYQFWRCQGTGFRGDGAFGQFTIVLPEQDVVIVMTSENKNMQGQLDLVWKHLLPALGETRKGAGELAGRLKNLKLLPLTVKVGVGSREGAQTKRYRLEPNDLGLTQASIVFEGDGCVFSVWAGEVMHRIECGMGVWKRGELAIPGTPPRLISGGKPKEGSSSKVAACAAWNDDVTLEMIWRYYETPHSDRVSCVFSDDEVRIFFVNSITAMNPKGKDPRGALVGRVLV